MCVEAAVVREMAFFTGSVRMGQNGRGILVKAAVHEGVMISVVLPGKVQSVWYVVTSSRFVAPFLLPCGRVVRVSVRGGMSNSALREVKLVWTGVMSSSLIEPILLSGGSKESANLGFSSGIEVGLGIGAQF